MEPILFFFVCAIARRALHSFPTRRSSDLRPPRFGRELAAIYGHDPALSIDYSPDAAPEPARENSRSEEHTSELQSRLHLVCRLLLEKKKAAKILPYLAKAKRRIVIEMNFG